MVEYRGARRRRQSSGRRSPNPKNARYRDFRCISGVTGEINCIGSGKKVCNTESGRCEPNDPARPRTLRSDLREYYAQAFGGDFAEDHQMGIFGRTATVQAHKQQYDQDYPQLWSVKAGSLRNALRARGVRIPPGTNFNGLRELGLANGLTPEEVRAFDDVDPGYVGPEEGFIPYPVQPGPYLRPVYPPFREPAGYPPMVSRGVQTDFPPQPAPRSRNISRVVPTRISRGVQTDYPSFGLPQATQNQMRNLVDDVVGNGRASAFVPYSQAGGRPPSRRSAPGYLPDRISARVFDQRFDCVASPTSQEVAGYFL